MKQFWISLFKAVRSRVFSHILICYAVLLVLFASSCGISFYHARSASLESITEKNNLILENAAKNITYTLEIVESFNNTLYKSTSLQNFMCSKNSDSVLYDAYMLIDELPSLVDSNGLLKGYFIYIPTVDYIVAPAQGFKNIPLYYSSYFSLSDSQSYETWYEQVLTGTPYTFHSGYPETSEIQYSTAVTSRITGIAPCRVVYKLDGQKLLDTLTGPFADTVQHALIEDKNGAVLCATEGYDSIKEDQYTRLSCNTASGNLKATLLVPHSLISAQAASSVSASFSALIWMTLLGLFLIVITAIANLKPLMHVAERAESIGSKAKGMWKINAVFEQEAEKSRALSQALSLHKSFLKNACANRLIHGKGLNGASLEEMLQNAGVFIRGSRLYAVIIALHEEDVAGPMQTLMLEVLSRFSDNLTVLALESEAVTLAVYSENEDEIDRRKSFFTDVYNALRENANIETAFYVGPVSESLDKLSDSFTTAAWLRSTSTMDTWLNLSDSIREDEDLGGILTEAEQGILKAKLLAGDREGLRSQLLSIENEYFVRRSTNGFCRQYIYCRLVEVLVSCASSLSVSKELPPDLLTMNPPEFFRWISEMLLRLAEEAGNRLQIKSNQLGEKVFRYIEEHYSDYELTLGSLSAQLKVTGPYLSGLFKKQSGTNFSVYLEKVRIRHAEELLKSADISVDELAQKVGYISADSFRRAFKRVNGVTPTQYRERVYSAPENE